MEIKLIKEIMKNFEKSNIHKIELEQDGFKIKLEKEDKQYVTAKEMEVPTVVTTVSNNEETKPVVTDNSVKVLAPLVGTFYGSPSPDAKPFVSVGSKVQKGQTLCIIEAMKVMNEISAPSNGTIKEILVKNSAMVEFDQVIMTIE
ncbi:acetyl-CoA carboxylase biotin carboxyl carrier protein [Mycoplasmatota bacterium]|nr:acetyl-CoA carboxylase biotin carboxyl carrier protein [Mycoplasmatota bacterium]